MDNDEFNCDNCSTNGNKSCAAINACSKDGFYSILAVLLAIAVVIVIYFIAKFLI